MNITPKVFISHASEDKDRFVLGFAKKLYAVGIEAWVGKWEMLPGDSLVDKIFEEGIKNAQAFIIVVSKYSVAKPWVKEELNTAIVNRSEDKLTELLDGKSAMFSIMERSSFTSSQMHTRQATANWNGITHPIVCVR